MNVSRFRYCNLKKIVKFIDSPREISHMMIEEFMLAANISAAELCLKHKMPSVFRVHPKPDILKIKNLEKFLRSRKINASLGDGSDIKKLTSLLKINENIINQKVNNHEIR